MQDDKSLCVAVMICTIVVNTQTHTQIFTSYTKSSASRAKIQYDTKYYS